MTFQAYIDNIQEKTGKTPEDFHTLAKKNNFLGNDVRPMEFVGWLKREFGLGHGHAMAILELFKKRNWIDSSSAKNHAGK
jgi:hypothetical protein